MGKVPAVQRPIVRTFKARFQREAIAHARAGGHSVIWERPSKARLVFPTPAPGDIHDFGAWAIYDMAMQRWTTPKTGPFRGLSFVWVPRDCHWIVKRRAERDSIHPAPTRAVAFDCTDCAACCRDNEVILLDEDHERLVAGGRADILKKPFARRGSDGRLVLTLMKNGRCHHLARDNKCKIYAVRPNACSEFPMGSECCLYAREDMLGLLDGAPATA